VPTACPACKGPYLERRGFGTEKVAHEIKTLWPSARVSRLDRDTVRRKGAATDILRSMAAGSIDILVGTQMIAKGHDFPRVTLVGVISADVGLGLADFRASERTFQLLTQVAGRAGRVRNLVFSTLLECGPIREPCMDADACRHDRPCNERARMDAR